MQPDVEEQKVNCKRHELIDHEVLLRALETFLDNSGDRVLEKESRVVLDAQLSDEVFTNWVLHVVEMRNVKYSEIDLSVRFHVIR